MAEDMRDLLFGSLNQRSFGAELIVENNGILSGVDEAKARADALGIEVELCKNEGSQVYKGDRVALLIGSAKQIAMAEETVIGSIAKTSGIATAAGKAVSLADGRADIVSGSWKKMPPELKHPVRKAIDTGGAFFRICTPPMVYLDKNIIRMLGSIPAALNRAKIFEGYTIVVQLKGKEHTIEEETQWIVEGGGDILMVDTGDISDLDRCSGMLHRMGVRRQVKLAFAGGIHIADIPVLAAHDLDIFCIGREIVDAPLLDFKLDVREGICK